MHRDPEEAQGYGARLGSEINSFESKTFPGKIPEGCRPAFNRSRPAIPTGPLD